MRISAFSARRRPLLSLVALGALGLALSACGSGGSSSTSTTSTTTASTAGTGSSGSTASTVVSTSGVLCPYNQSTFVSSFSLTSKSDWACASGKRTLTANGIPDHAIGPFSNPDLAFKMTEQSISFSATLTPTLASSTNTSAQALGYALNGVKMDPGTGGSCASSITKASDCSMLPQQSGSGPWIMEALGQKTFDFGADVNNAHVQPSGQYHYHGIPEGTLTKAGVTSSNPKMTLIGWAPDGFPIYARYGRSVATDATSPLKVIKSSYSVKSTPDAGRPSVSIVPMGAFTQDYQYVAGSGDLDECNGRFDVTPEFPNGIYHYYGTDTYPYLTRCWKGVTG